MNKTLFLLPLFLFSCSCPQSYTEVARPMLSSAADVEKISDCQMQHYGCSLLAEAPDAASAAALLQRGASINGKIIRNGQAVEGSALYYNNRIEVMRYLLQHGAAPDSVSGTQRETSLNKALREGQLPKVELLLRHGADPNLCNSAGDTPLATVLKSQASPESKNALLESLLRHGALPNRPNAAGKSALHLAGAAQLPLLLSNGANPNALDSMGRSPLFYVDSAESAQLLLQNGADSSLRDCEGNSAFDTVSVPQAKSYLLIHGCRSGHAL